MYIYIHTHVYIVRTRGKAIIGMALRAVIMVTHKQAPVNDVTSLTMHTRVSDTNIYIYIYIYTVVWKQPVMQDIVR